MAALKWVRKDWEILTQPHLENVLQRGKVYHSELTDDREDNGDAEDLVAEEPNFVDHLLLRPGAEGVEHVEENETAEKNQNVLMDKQRSRDIVQIDTSPNNKIVIE